MTSETRIAAALAAKDAEIATLRAQVQLWRDHIDRSAEIENVADLYRHDPLAMADAIVRMREDLGRLRSVVEEPHDVPPEERDRP